MALLAAKICADNHHSLLTVPAPNFCVGNESEECLVEYIKVLMLSRAMNMSPDRFIFIKNYVHNTNECAFCFAHFLSECIYDFSLWSELV